jgi:epoxyqueuosine reductase QueG
LLTARHQLPAGSIADRNHYQKTARFAIEFVELDMCRELEKLGYSALPQARVSHESLCKLCGVAATEDTEILTGLVLCSAPLVDRAETHISATNPAEDLKQQLKAIAKEQGADLFGVASAKTIDELADQIRAIRKDETIFSAVDKNHLLKAYDPEITQHKRAIHGATDVLPGAKSVIVLGMHYPETPAVRLGQPPAEAVAPYVFTQFETNRLSALMAYSICRTLNGMGYEAIFTHNLTGAGSWVGSPKGLHHDATCNALEAVAAGIGQMALNGTAVTEEYGIHQRFVAIVTNADLEADAVKGGLASACVGCEKCLNACPTCALRKDALTELTLAGEKVTYLPVDANRCDWATKFALVAEEGNMYTGNYTNVPCPDEITAEVLADALRQHDPLFKNRPVIGQRCVINCPLR